MASIGIPITIANNHPTKGTIEKSTGTAIGELRMMESLKSAGLPVVVLLTWSRTILLPSERRIYVVHITQQGYYFKGRMSPSFNPDVTSTWPEEEAPPI